jgi:putative endonuclease
MPDGRTINNKTLGREGEDAAARHLQERGYAILRRNFHVGRSPEIDIVARKDGMVCFVEVKSRSSDRFGAPSEAVTAGKAARIKKAAALYAGLHGAPEASYRFDVVEVDANTGSVRHIEDAAPRASCISKNSVKNF